MLPVIATVYNPRGPTPCISVGQSSESSFEQAVNNGSLSPVYKYLTPA